MSTVEEIVEKALELSSVDRAAVAERLIRSLDLPGRDADEELVEEEWKAEIKARSDALHAGEAEIVEREQVRDEIRSSISFEPPGEDLSEEQWAAAWGPELERRIAAYERGEIAAHDWRESMDLIRRDLSEKRRQ